jgi:2-methylfumaryl-CoA isomerase
MSPAPALLDTTMSHDLLRGLRVIESSAFIAAPLAGLTLAQFGAEVIRIEMIGGGIDYARMPRMPGGRSLYWTGLNKGKRSIAIDLRRAEGRDLVRALVTAPGEGGGVLLTNIATPWLAHASLQPLRPDLVSCTISGNADGSTAVDYTVNSATGFPYITGGATPEKPVNHALPAWDIATAYQAAMAITAAVDQRRRSGVGAELQLALSDLAFTMLSHLGYATEATLLQQDRPSIGNHLYGAFGRDFGCADGHRVMVAAVSAGQWKTLVAACGLGAPLAELQSRCQLDFSDEAQRYEARDAIAALFAPWFAARPLSEVARALDAAGACWGPYRSARALFESDPRASLANPVYEMHDTPGVGRHLAAGSAVRIAGAERQPTRPAPLLGADTDAVLTEVLALDAGQIAALHRTGVVAGPQADPTQGGAGTARA